MLAVCRFPVTILPGASEVKLGLESTKPPDCLSRWHAELSHVVGQNAANF